MRRANAFPLTSWGNLTYRTCNGIHCIFRFSRTHYPAKVIFNDGCPGSETHVGPHTCPGLVDRLQISLAQFRQIFGADRVGSLMSVCIPWRCSSSRCPSRQGNLDCGSQVSFHHCSLQCRRSRDMLTQILALRFCDLGRQMIHALLCASHTTRTSRT